MCRKREGWFFLCGCHFHCFHPDGGYVFSCSIADNLGQLGGSGSFSSFCPETPLAICHSEVCFLQGLSIYHVPLLQKRVSFPALY